MCNFMEKISKIFEGFLNFFRQMFGHMLILKPRKEIPRIDKMQSANITRFPYAILVVQPNVFSLAKTPYNSLLNCI